MHHWRIIETYCQTVGNLPQKTNNWASLLSCSFFLWQYVNTDTLTVQNANKKDNFRAESYAERKGLFGLIVFKSKADLDPLTVYLAYSQRWSVETLFWLYKNIIDRDTVNVHSDYSVYATELINFLSVVITTRVKNEFVKLGLSKKYSYKAIFRYLSKYKKVRTKDGGKWGAATMLKYIEELVAMLGV